MHCHVSMASHSRVQGNPTQSSLAHVQVDTEHSGPAAKIQPTLLAPPCSGLERLAPKEQPSLMAHSSYYKTSQALLLPATLCSSPTLTVLSADLRCLCWLMQYKMIFKEAKGSGR